MLERPPSPPQKKFELTLLNSLTGSAFLSLFTLNSRWLFQKAQEKMCEIEQRKCKYDINPFK